MVKGAVIIESVTNTAAAQVFPAGREPLDKIKNILANGDSPSKYDGFD